MNSVNLSTGFSPFQLHIGCAPRMIPPLSELREGTDNTNVHSFLSRLELDILEVQDNLATAKILQAVTANRHRSPDPLFTVGDLVLLSTKNRRREYVAKGSGRVAKFMPRFDGPYHIVRADHSTSSYTLKLPAHSQISPTFHISQLRKFCPNDPELFPDCGPPRPEPILTPDGKLEHWIDRIVEEHHVGHGRQYLVRWEGFGVDEDEWLPRRELIA